jgi:hypothetical protein
MHVWGCPFLWLLSFGQTKESDRELLFNPYLTFRPGSKQWARQAAPLHGFIHFQFPMLKCSALALLFNLP